MSITRLVNNLDVHVQRSRESLRSTHTQRDNTNRDNDSDSTKSTRSASFLAGDKFKYQMPQSEPAATYLHPALLPHSRHSSFSTSKKSQVSGSYHHPHAAHETKMPPSMLQDVEAIRKLLEIVQDTPNGRRAVARLARTCKAFNQPAMDVLWNELDSFLPLIGLFPTYIMKRPKRPELGLTKMPVDADWHGLLPYADRVRKITYEEGIRTVPPSIFPVFEDHSPRRWILPNLTHLVWKCDTPDGLDRGKIFLNPGLQSLTLEIGHNFPNLSHFLSVLSIHTRLSAFSLSSLGKLPEDFSRVMTNQDLLEKVSIISPGALDAKVGKWVSELPELKSLKLDLTDQGNVEGFFDEIIFKSGWSTPESEESKDSGVFSEFDATQIKKITAFSGSRGPKQGAYPQLRQLHLTGQAGSVVTFLKQHIGPIHTLELAIEDPPKERDWQGLCAVICDKFSDSLRSLRILSAAPVKQVDLPRSPGRLQDPILRRLPLFHFTSLPRLAEFEIDLPESVVFDNSDIAHLATICPAIEVLKLCPQARWPSNLPPPSVTLDGIALLTSGCKHLHTLELALTANAGSDETLTTHSVSSGSLYRLHLGNSHLEDPIQVAILLSHIAPRLDSLKWSNERGPRSSSLGINAEGWHKVSEYLPHFQTVRLAEKKMSALEVAPPREMLEKSADATVTSIDAGVQALVTVTESSVQFSPDMVDQEISAIPGVVEASVDARPSSTEAGIQAIPTLLEKSVEAAVEAPVVKKVEGPSTDATPKSPEAITETAAPKETPASNHTEAPPKTPSRPRAVGGSRRFFTLPIRFLLCSAKPVEDENIPAENTPPSNATNGK